MKIDLFSQPTFTLPVTVTTTANIGGVAQAVVFLETADTNSTNPLSWTVIAQQSYANNISQAALLSQQQANAWALSRIIPAGKYVRIRSGSLVGTASVTLNPTQQETLQ